MSGISPARRLRSKTSDISEFFRGTGHNTQQSRQTPSIDVPQLPSDPSQVVEESSSPLNNKKRSKIPFLGRSRKKSSELGSRVSSTHDSNKTSRPNSGISDDGPTVQLEASSSRPPLPSTLPPLNVSPQSLGSKFAAHFIPTKTKPFTLVAPPKSALKGKSPADAGSSSLSPPIPNSRTSSFESNSSNTSQDRSPTPRAVQPTITVSISPPEDLSEYADLFIDPLSTPSSLASPAKPNADSPAHTENFDDDTDNLTQSPTPPTSPRMQFPYPPFDIGLTRSRHSDSTNSDAKVKITTSQAYLEHDPAKYLNVVPDPPLHRVRSHSSKTKQYNAAEAANRGLTNYVRDLSEASDASKLWASTQKRRSLATMPYQPSEDSARGKPPAKSNSIKTRPSGPPSIPLPPPPSHPPPKVSNMPPMSSIPTIPSLQSLPSGKSITRNHIDTNSRPRAHTINALSPPTSSQNSPPTPVSPSQHESKGHNRQTFVVNPEKENINIDKATPDQLRQALRAQFARFDELSAYLLDVNERHIIEKIALDKKIDLLEQEAKKRDKEIKGLRWLVMNNPGSGVPSSSSQASRSAIRLELDPVAPRIKTPSLRGPRNRDSDTESPHESSGIDSDSPSARALRRAGHRPPTVSSLRSSTRIQSSGLGIDISMPETPYLAGANKRSSVSSFSSSPASSTSSLSLPSLTTTTTASSGLSAIPEAPPPASRGPATAPAAETQSERDERRASRVPRRISSSSVASSTTSAATSAYAANLKRSRPPSIAQVLDQSPAVDDMLEQLRVLGGTSAPPAS